MRWLALAAAGCSFHHGHAASDAVADDPLPLADAPADRAADAVACIAAPSGLIAFWPAEGSARDVVGGHDGVLVDNANASTPGEVGTAFGFDGNLDQVTIGSPPTSTTFTVEGWIDLAVASTYITVYADAARGFWTRSGMITWWDGVELYATPNTVTPGAMHHVAFTYDGTYMIGYIDGIGHGSVFVAGTSLPSGSDTGIGGHMNEYATGRIDELSVYNRALSAEEIAAITTAGANGKCRP
jgi:hypothetical protein